MTIDWAAPSLCGIAGARRAMGALERAGMSPRMALFTWQAAIRQVDVRDILGSVGVSTLVLHRKGDAVPLECGRELAAKIPGARLVELDGVDHMPFVGDMKSITGEVEEFLTGHRHEPPIDRMLATVLFTDIVDSTRRAAELGDRRWRELLDRHDEITFAEISSFQGRVIKQTGDGVLATFDGPTRAVLCAIALAIAYRGSASIFEAACTPVSANGAVTTSAESPSTSRRESQRGRMPGRSLYRTPSKTSFTVPGSLSKTEVPTCSKACPASGACSPRRADMMPSMRR